MIIRSTFTKDKESKLTFYKIRIGYLTTPSKRLRLKGKRLRLKGNNIFPEF